MNKIKQVCFAGLLALPVMAHAQFDRGNTPDAGSNVNYTYVGIQYLSQRLDNYNCTQGGLNLYGSLDIQEGWFAQGSLTDVSGNRGCGSTTLSAGGGYRTAFSDTFDMFGTLSFESSSTDSGESDSGVALSAGLRGFVRDQMEARFAVAHGTVLDGYTEFNAGLAYWFTGQLAGTLDGAIGSNTSTIAFGVRLNF